MAVAEHPLRETPQLPRTTTTEVDERAARRSLRDQITRLERELASAFVASFPRQGIDWRVPEAPRRSRGPRVLTLGELERVRDDLAERLTVVRRQLHLRADDEEAKREL